MAGIFRSLLRKAPQLIRSATPVVSNGSILRSISTSQFLHGPKVQEPAPYFEGIAVYGDEFKLTRLQDFKGKFLILFFYPLDFTFVCPTELIAIENFYKEFERANATVVGVSVDSHYTHHAWMNTSREKGGLGKLSFPLLSDINKTIAKDYGVLLEKEGVALRGMFIIDPKGILRVITINDIPIGRNIEEALRLVDAIQFVEDNGEVCPANWKKGSPTIKPDPKGSQEYFNKINK